MLIGLVLAATHLNVVFEVAALQALPVQRDLDALLRKRHVVLNALSCRTSGLRGVAITHQDSGHVIGALGEEGNDVLVKRVHLEAGQVGLECDATEVIHALGSAEGRLKAVSPMHLRNRITFSSVKTIKRRLGSALSSIR